MNDGKKQDESLPPHTTAITGKSPRGMSPIRLMILELFNDVSVEQSCLFKRYLYISLFVCFSHYQVGNEDWPTNQNEPTSSSILNEEHWKHRKKNKTVITITVQYYHSSGSNLQLNEFFPNSLWAHVWLCTFPSR